MKQALVVDDDQSVAGLAVLWLKRAGFAPTSSNSYSEASSRLRGRHPETLIVDVRLGEVNGLQLAIMARQRWSEVRIVVITGWDDPVLRREAEQCGAAYLLKPFSASQLLAAIESAPSPAGPSIHG